MSTPPKAPTIRFAVDPGDVPAEKVARRLHLTAAGFEAVRMRLYMRGFPRPDPDTGMYDLEAVDRWRHRRNPSLFPELFTYETLPGDSPARDLGAVAREGHERRQAQNGGGAGIRFRERRG